MPQLAALAALAPLASNAAPASQGNTTIHALMLPVMLAFALGLHALIARGAKAVFSASRRLASGEAEACGYERRVYHSAVPQMLIVVCSGLCAGLLLWLGYVTGSGWFWAAGVLAVLGTVALDLWCWERVTASASCLWFQRGLTGQVHQILIDNILDVSVDERAVRKLPTLRHGFANRVCRLRVVLRDKQVIALPKTDANAGLEEVEAVANFVRARQQQSHQRKAIDEAEQRGARAAAEAAAAPAHADAEAEMRLALRRLRQKSLAPEAPPAVSSQVKR